MIIDMIILTPTVTVIYCFLLSICYASVLPNINMSSASSLKEITKAPLR